MDWYYSDGQQQFGPVSQAEFDMLVASGRIGANTLVWRAGMANWAAFATVQPPAQAVAPQPIAPIAAAAVELRAPQPQQPQWPQAQQAQPQWPQQPQQQPQPQQPQARFCTNCGRPFPPGDLLQIGNATVCASCKDVMMQRLREGAVPGGLLHQGRQYGGFWLRFVAVFIDGIILGVVGAIIDIPLQLVLVGTSAMTDPTLVFGRMMGVFSIMIVLNMAIGLVYESWFLVNKGGATPGKMVLSLEVVRTDGGRITWGLAIGRYFAKILSSWPTLWIGYIMAGLDDEKRALHDRICNTRVIRK
jgi:uncharacterized RDD family membrane protein YckC